MAKKPGAPWETVEDALRRVEEYVVRERYRGYDPYDALMSPLFRLPILKKQKALRWGAQQVVKRLPVNIRPLLGVRKGCNPVTLALCLQGFASRARSMPEERGRYGVEMRWLLDEIGRLQSPGYSGPCWGYDFDWEARYARIPAFMPTIVATGFVTNAIYRSREFLDAGRVAELLVGAARFIRRDLNRIEEDGRVCFSYSPSDRNVVLNATMKGARLLAQAFSLTGDRSMADEARSTVQFVMHYQRPDGAWAYQLQHASTAWVDNFHTGYVLDCLDEYVRLTGDTAHRDGLERGLAYYLEHFFEGGEIPKYYDVRRYPIDPTAAAQSLLTLTRFGRLDLARSVALWMIAHMQHRTGYFYYQQHRWYTNRIPYMRWSSAWMFAGLAALWEQRHDLA